MTDRTDLIDESATSLTTGIETAPRKAGSLRANP